MKRPGVPALSARGQEAVAQYATYLRGELDLSPTTVRSYLSDLQQFAAWCEATWARGQEAAPSFAPAALTTPCLTRYRTYLQQGQHLKPTTINRALVSLKRYCAWATEQGLLARDPAAVVKLVREEERAPRTLSDADEDALLAAVTAGGSVRDRTIVVLLLHTGLRASELCRLRRANVQLGKRSGTLQVLGKRNKHRAVPLNATARNALTEYLPTLEPQGVSLFPSGKTGGTLSERALGHLIQKYARRAHLVGISPHVLRHRFGYRMAAVVPLHRLAQIMGHDSLDTTLRYVGGTPRDLQREVEKIAWE
jgi:integrase/recombinase XerC